MLISRQVSSFTSSAVSALTRCWTWLGYVLATNAGVARWRWWSCWISTAIRLRSRSRSEPMNYYSFGIHPQKAAHHFAWIIVVIPRGDIRTCGVKRISYCISDLSPEYTYGPLEQVGSYHMSNYPCDPSRRLVHHRFWPYTTVIYRLCRLRAIFRLSARFSWLATLVRM